MASILFDDITFPRELYDPDTLTFVAPVSTLLSFTPHILSQLAKDSEKDQEPFLPKQESPQPTTEAPTQDGRSTNATNNSGGIFSTLKQVAADQSARKILENGLYLATQIIDSSSSSSSRHQDYDYRHASSQASSSSYWFGNSSRYELRDQERRRLQDLEARLRQMERDMAQSSLLARSEIESQRQARTKLEQELEAQKARVKKLERDAEEQKEKEKKREHQQQEEEEEEEKNKQKKKEEEEAQKKKEKSKMSKEEEEAIKDSEKKPLIKKEDGSDTAINAVVLATVGAASLVMTLYSAHKASSLYSVVTFHDQLEVLLTQCEGVVQSTEAWISEQFLEVPDQIHADLKMIKELMETIQRLDPRSEKKAETIAWSMSAVGSLGAVGGAVIGSMTAIASGGTLVVGCALYGIVSRARYNGPEYKGARAMLEMRAIQILKSLGVNPSAPITTNGGQGAKSRIHYDRIERLRIEFEKREGHDMKDADEIDGLIVEEALREASFSAPYVPSSRSPMASRKKMAATTTERRDDTLMTPQHDYEQKIHKQQARLSTASLA
ncbi:hypothetical protein BG006_000402 [Podila minutissima]|uniref:Uncharacterized protein n=1 Tax=Podila minutissima TaxID=64525 RepID=A0A9P5SBF9_9FUNG|nr:hypothetical protein BG006_000402 [Podila minutissima]